MNHIILENFRCFGERQFARMAPLTLLVGENSTGKTSFQAMIRPLLAATVGWDEPNFQEAPYDLGNFYDIAHHRGSRGGRAKSFMLGFGQTIPGLGRYSSTRKLACELSVTFAKDGAIPVPVVRRHSVGDVWFEEELQTKDSYLIRYGIKKRQWKLPLKHPVRGIHTVAALPLSIPLPLFLRAPTEGNSEFSPMSGSPPLTEQDAKRLHRYFSHLGRYINAENPFAGAPVRSNPHRTYHPASTTVDLGGDYVPMYLADVFYGDKKNWAIMKDGLEAFGKSAGLFDEISIRPLTKRSSGPFQLEFRKFGGRLKGPKRNVLDMGYGISQILPVITEILRGDSNATMFLLQQPEVHLHPSAQAALGTLLCQVASSGRQMIVETHSDYILDRVRMDVRDGTVPLKPEDVSILFFERSGLDAHIHSLELDRNGNVLNVPTGYRSFFMQETRRSIMRGNP